ncbi:probable amp deaminase, partial [Thalassiosira pseudonana CCMP1335]
NGVVEIYEASDFRRTNNLVTVPSLESFVTDYQRLVEIASSGAMRSFAFQRLQMLTAAFKMHITINGSAEDEAQSGLLGTDFYRTMKVDNHIHLAAAASAKQFVNFVRDKLENEGDTVVMEDGQTLKEVFEKAGLDSNHLTIDAFNVLADYSVYQRFDNFNNKYSPFRMAQMRKIFLKTDNHIDGRYFAELTKIVLARHEQRKGHTSAAEMRLSIYGMERNEWLQLAKWVLRDWKGGDFSGNMISTHNRWLVQVPRLWRVYCKKGKGTNSFQQMLENLFIPLFEATLYPEEHPEVAELLNHIVGFDSVDDEGSLEAPLSCCKPATWKQEDNPAYCWQLYYLWANIEILNRVRASKGLNQLAFRPHAGETGDSMHLAATYMLCRSINHGINLDKQVSLQYLYYLDQVGMSISPLSNNFLFRKIAQSPFPKMFKRGLNVTLSTDDPLLFHMSDDALLEEYSVARASFDLSMTDISEIARNSVLQSGFEASLKEEWLGKNFRKGVTHCDENKTHVPLIRAKFRAEHLALEHLMV